MNIRKTTAAVGVTALLAAPLSLFGSTPAHADGPEREREFRLAGAEVDFSVEKDDGRFEVEVDIDEARRGSKWRVVLRNDGKVFHNKVHRADGDGEVEIDKKRRNTAGKDVFKVKVKKVGGKATTRAIRMR
jgi:hypothetical protein